MSTTAILRRLATGPATAGALGQACRLAPGAVRAAIAQLESQRLIHGVRPHGASPDRVFSLTLEGKRRAEGVQTSGETYRTAVRDIWASPESRA